MEGIAQQLTAWGWRKICDELGIKEGSFWKDLNGACPCGPVTAKCWCGRWDSKDGRGQTSELQDRMGKDQSKLYKCTVRSPVFKMRSFILIQNLGWLNTTWAWEGAKTNSIHPETPAGPAHTPLWTSVMALLIWLLCKTTSLDRTKSKWEVWVLGCPLWLCNWCEIVGNHFNDCQAPLAILLLSRQLTMNRLRGLLITLPFLIAFDFYQQLEGRELLCREILENCPLSKELSLLWYDKTESLEEDVKHSRWAEAVAGRLWDALPC